MGPATTSHAAEPAATASATAATATTGTAAEYAATAAATAKSMG